MTFSCSLDIAFPVSVGNCKTIVSRFSITSLPDQVWKNAFDRDFGYRNVYTTLYLGFLLQFHSLGFRIFRWLHNMSLHCMCKQTLVHVILFFCSVYYQIFCWYYFWKFVSQDFLFFLFVFNAIHILDFPFILVYQLVNFLLSTICSRQCFWGASSRVKDPFWKILLLLSANSIQGFLKECDISWYLVNLD